MHHPGPPRFVAVGEQVELAPSDPDPEGTYEWRIAGAPVSSVAELGPDPVETFVPDAPGRYAIELDAPDGVHELTVRAFPADSRPAEAAGGASGASGFASGSARPSNRSGGVSGSGSGSGAGGGGGGGGGRPRVQLRGRVEGDEVIVRANATPNPNDDRPADELDVEFLLDDRDPLGEDDVSVEGHELRVPASALPEYARVHAVAVGESYSVADAVAIRREGAAADRPDGPVDAAGAGVEVLRLNDPPAWATDATLYEVYVRGFAGDDEAPNTFAAIENRLDYLDDLGVDTLWLTPVLQNDDAPHGYNITDFFSIADDLGEREDYESLVEAAHDRGMKVLFDLVLNHSARQHPFFEDAYRNPDSPYYDWYEWQENGEPGTYFDWEKIANFDFSNLLVRRHLLDAVDTWAEVADGFRCDMAWAVSRPFWTELRERLKARDAEFLLLDETIPYIPDFHELAFDMHFDTTLYFTLRQVGRGVEPADAILDAVDGRTESGFPDHAAFMLYLENHDETRYIVECGDPEAKAAAGALCTLPGVPMLYAGQEIGQRGRRDAIAWEHAREEFRDLYERLLELREETPALREDAPLSRVEYEADDRAVAFARGGAGGAGVADGGTIDDRGVVVALNFGADPAVVSVDADVDPTNLVTGDSAADEGGLRVDSVGVFRRA